MKICTKCHIEKSESNFYIRKATGYFQSWCKKCLSIYRKQYNKENREKVKEFQKRYQEENRDKIRETEKHYQKKNAKKLRRMRKEYKKENAEKINAQNVQHRKRMSDQYIKKLIANQISRGSGTTIKFKNIPNEIIELKRKQIQIKRLIKQQSL